MTDDFNNTAQGTSFEGARSFNNYLINTTLFETEQATAENFDHLAKLLRTWLKKQNFKKAEILMDLMLEYNEGKTRQDGITPSALHEITQAIWFISCIEDGLYCDDIENILSLIFIHDLGEDYNLRPEDLESHLNYHGIKSDQKMEELKEGLDAISKHYGENEKNNQKKNNEYFIGVQQNKLASIAKLLDRTHNFMTMANVKERNKIWAYIASTEVMIPKVKREAAKQFPQHEKLYSTLEYALKEVIQTTRYHLLAEDQIKPLTDDEHLEKSMARGGFRDLPHGIHPTIVAAGRIRSSKEQEQSNTPENGDDNNPNMG